MISSAGGILGLEGATLHVPPGSLRKPTKISATLVDPVDFYPHVINAGLISDIRFACHVVKLEPHDQQFLKNYALEIDLTKTITEDEQLVVIHGTVERGSTPSWKVLDPKHIQYLKDGDKAVISAQSFSWNLLVYWCTKATRALSCFGKRPMLFRVMMFLKNVQPSKRLRVVFVADEVWSIELLRNETVIPMCEQDGYKKSYVSNPFELMDSDHLQFELIAESAFTLDASDTGVRRLVVDSVVWQNTGEFIEYDLCCRREDGYLSIKAQLNRTDENVVDGQESHLVQKFVYQDGM